MRTDVEEEREQQPQRVDRAPALADRPGLTMFDRAAACEPDMGRSVPGMAAPRVRQPPGAAGESGREDLKLGRNASSAKPMRAR